MAVKDKSPFRGGRKRRSLYKVYGKDGKFTGELIEVRYLSTAVEFARKRGLKVKFVRFVKVSEELKDRKELGDKEVRRRIVWQKGSKAKRDRYRV